jgi:hypothetical protein
MVWDALAAHCGLAPLSAAQQITQTEHKAPTWLPLPLLVRATIFNQNLKSSGTLLPRRPVLCRTTDWEPCSARLRPVFPISDVLDLFQALEGP